MYAQYSYHDSCRYGQLQSSETHEKRMFHASVANGPILLGILEVRVRNLFLGWAFSTAKFSLQTVHCSKGPHAKMLLRCLELNNGLRHLSTWLRSWQSERTHMLRKIARPTIHRTYELASAFRL